MSHGTAKSLPSLRAWESGASANWLVYFSILSVTSTNSPGKRIRKFWKSCWAREKTSGAPLPACRRGTSCW